MPSRLVLGTGPITSPVLEYLGDRPGDLVVLTDDEHQVETLRTAGRTVHLGDPTDGATMRTLVTDPVVVAVTGADGDRNLATARAARAEFPGASIVAYAGADREGRSGALGRVADHVVDPGPAVADAILEAAGEAGRRLRELHGVLGDVDGRLAIVTHDNPDPDAIASAVALSKLAGSVGCETELCYYGEIAHQENRALVNVLEYDLTNLEPDADVSAYDGFALVDHSRPGVNDQLPAETPIDVVIDHHPPRLPVEARFVDLRSDVGATSTLLVDYLKRTGRPPASAVATGLLFGIRVDTQDFRREVAVQDFEAAAYLVPHADLDVLRRVEHPSVSADTLDTVCRAILGRTHEGAVLLSYVPDLSDRDALAQAADQLLNLEDVQATMVYGVIDGTIYLSARARGTDVDLGETLRDAFGQIGSAGGHADMAGAQITMGVLEAVEEREESRDEIVRSVVEERVLASLRSRSDHLLPTVYPTSEYGVTGHGLEEEWGEE